MKVLKSIFSAAVIAEVFQTFLLAGSVFFIIWFFLFRPFQVSGSSMYPTFEDREYVLTNIIGMRFSDPKRGDVVVFQSPTEPGKDFIKRVIGMPDDSIMLKEGDIYINGEKIDQSDFLSTDIKTFPGVFLQEGTSVTIPKDAYVVMGDNRGNSSDSRDWGFIKRADIVGQTVFVYWPPSHAKLIKNPLE